jgi:hypothetical protein
MALLLPLLLGAVRSRRCRDRWDPVSNFGSLLFVSAAVAAAMVVAGPPALAGPVNCEEIVGNECTTDMLETMGSDAGFKCSSVLNSTKTGFGSCTPDENCIGPRNPDGTCPQVIDQCLVGRCVESPGNPPTFTCEGENKDRLAVDRGGCSDGSTCTADGCADGLCRYFLLDGICCNDGNACTVQDTCKVGVCEGVAAPAGTGCDDTNPCTDSDECADDGTCVGTPCDACTCDDENACTTNDMCTGGLCVGTGVADGMPCDDGIACTNTVCNGLECGGGTLDDSACVTDDNPCTEQTCTSAGCRTSLITGTTACLAMNGGCLLGTRACQMGSPTGGCVPNDPPEPCP